MPEHAHEAFAKAGVALVLAAVFFIAAASSVHAAGNTLDERAQRLAQELRCLVCQNQSIADSHAELAVQLKGELREQLKQGATDEQVRQFMVARYGEFVLYRPPLNITNALLWGSPLLLLLAGSSLFAAHLRERKRAQQGLPDSLLPDDEDEGRGAA